MEDLRRQHAALEQRDESLIDYHKERAELQRLYLATVELQRERWMEDAHRCIDRIYPSNEAHRRSPWRLWSETWCLMVTAKMRRDVETYCKFQSARHALKKKHGLSPSVSFYGVRRVRDLDPSLKYYDPFEADIYQPRIDDPLVPDMPLIDWKPHPILKGDTFMAWVPFALIFCLLIDGGPFHDIAWPSAFRISVRCCVGILVAALLARSLVVYAAVHDAGKKFLKLCRESGVKGLEPCSRLWYFNTYFCIAFSVVALLVWPWQIILPVSALSAPVFWYRRKRMFGSKVFTDMDDLNETIARFGTIDNWPTYEQVLLGGNGDGVRDEKDGGDFIIDMK